MITDARGVPSGTVIETELCIVGAGAAGITLAREFRDSPFRVALLESGGMEFDPDTQDLYDGESIGLPITDLRAARLRFFGGTTNHWGGYCLPLDPIDFEPRDDSPYHGWPFPRSHLDPWYARAQAVCQLGAYDYRPSSWGMGPSKVPAPFTGPIFETKLLQENPVRFGPAYVEDLRGAQRVTAFLHANAVSLDGGETDASIRKLSVRTLSGTEFTVQARLYVLASGGIENARLLLASGKDGRGLGDPHGVVGRFFMVHLPYSPGIIVPSDPRMNFDFMTNGPYSPDTYRIDPIIGLSERAMRDLRLPSIMLGWTYEFAPVRGAIEALKRLTDGRGPGGSTLSDLSKVIGNLDGVVDFAARKLLFKQGIPVRALHLWCSSEARPNPMSRIFLGTKRDPLGVPEIVIDWRLADEDRMNAAATVRMLGAEVGRTGFGRLRSSFGENDAWPNDFRGDEHHMGTTRMHRDPTLGVVDETCRVHAVTNLYIAGSSVFPTGGSHNPTLTIVALALRLADHLKKKLS